MTKENWEYSWRDYYEILQLHPSAETEAIKAVYRKLVQIHNTDQHTSGTEQKWKDLNEAFGILGNPEKKARYDVEYFKRVNGGPPTSTACKPKPVVRPSVVHIDNAIPGEIRRALLIIRNEGGPFSKVFLSKSNEWMKIIPKGSLSDTTKLPFQIGLELTGEDWGKSYSDNIIVKLDNEETHVHVELNTMLQPKNSSTQTEPISKPPPSTPKPTRSKEDFTPNDYPYTPLKDVPGQINLFAQTQCSFCGKFYDVNHPCKIRTLASNCPDFQKKSSTWQQQELLNSRHYWYVSSCLNHVMNSGKMARCLDQKCLALNPRIFSGTTNCWKCGHDSLVCPEHKGKGIRPILFYDVTKREWRCPDLGCTYHSLLPSMIGINEQVIKVSRESPPDLSSLKERYRGGGYSEPPKTNTQNGSKKPTGNSKSFFQELKDIIKGD